MRLVRFRTLPALLCWLEIVDDLKQTGKSDIRGPIRLVDRSEISKLPQATILTGSERPRQAINVAVTWEKEALTMGHQT